MSATTLQTSFATASSEPAVIVPPKDSSSPAFTASYHHLHTNVVLLQRHLANLGISQADAVSIALPNSYEFVVAFLATSSQRAIAAPINPAYTQVEFEFYIDDLKSAIIIVPQGAVGQNSAAVRAARKFGAAVAECYYSDCNDGEISLSVKDLGRSAKRQGQRHDLLNAEPDDVCLVLHTSGTTGKPKAVPLSHRNLTTTMKNIQKTYELGADDRTYLVMPLFHVHGLLAGLLAPLYAGGSVIVPPRFSASVFWHHFTTYGANWFTAVPTIHHILLKTPLPSHMPNIRFIRSCSSSLAPTTHFDLEEKLRAPVLEAYAMTEAAHQMTSNPLPPAERRRGSVGIGTGVAVLILDDAGKSLSTGTEGEVCISGDNVTGGYINNAQANASSFVSTEGRRYFRTGDQGRLDQDGYLTITGRIKELINKGGEKISPIELDNLLSQNEDVAEVVSFGIADEQYGEDIGAAVVSKKKGQPRIEENLKNWMAERTMKFKIPKKIWIVDAIPKTATGKIQRRKVAEVILSQQKNRRPSKL